MKKLLCGFLLATLVAPGQTLVKPPLSTTPMQVHAYQLWCGDYGCWFEDAPVGTAVSVRATMSFSLRGNHLHQGEPVNNVSFQPNPSVVLGGGIAYFNMFVGPYSGVFDLTATALYYRQGTSQLFVQKPITDPITSGYTTYIHDSQHIQYAFLNHLAAQRMGIVALFYHSQTPINELPHPWTMSTLRASLNWGGMYDDGLFVPYWWYTSYGVDSHMSGNGFDVSIPTKKAQRDALQAAAGANHCVVTPYPTRWHLEC